MKSVRVTCQVHLPDTIPILNPKKKPTAAPPSPAEMIQRVALSVQSQADCWTTLEEERLSVRREAAELVTRGVSDPEEITSCSTGTSSSLTDSMVGSWHLSPLFRHTLLFTGIIQMLKMSVDVTEMQRIERNVRVCPYFHYKQLTSSFKLIRSSVRKLCVHSHISVMNFQRS